MVFLLLLAWCLLQTFWIWCFLLMLAWCVLNILDMILWMLMVWCLFQTSYIWCFECCWFDVCFKHSGYGVLNGADLMYVSNVFSVASFMSVSNNLDMMFWLLLVWCLFQTFWIWCFEGCCFEVCFKQHSHVFGNNAPNTVVLIIHQ